MVTINLSPRLGVPLNSGERTLIPGYPDKFEKIKKQTLFDKLNEKERKVVREIAIENHFTLQELRKFTESTIDLSIWNETSLISLWQQWRENSGLTGREYKKRAFNKLDKLLKDLGEKEIEYPERQENKPSSRSQKIVLETSEDKIFGLCPVYSEKTLCCNLHTIDAVKNCGFGCSYCSIQSMYTDDNILFDRHFSEKLDAIELDPERHYHIGTGQSSDALMWGNTNDILNAIFRFARKWPNALVELKSKSKNIKHLIESDVPQNIICSWSLNPDIIIRNEEHLTPSLSKRLDVARSVADRGTRVGFHLHPMVVYRGWEEDYSALIKDVMNKFHTDEIVFVSFGALTFPKPIIRKIRTYGIKSKIYQMPMVPNPEGKMTYPDEIKKQLFQNAWTAFKPWHKKVFFYLCMEEKEFWESTFGKAYHNNKAFEGSLMKSAWEKLTC
jgi:spore photoproduct lyase